MTESAREGGGTRAGGSAPYRPSVLSTEPPEPMSSFFQLLTDLLHHLTALLHDAVMPLLRELTIDALAVYGLIQAWEKVFRRKRRPSSKPPPDG